MCVEITDWQCEIIYRGDKIENILFLICILYVKALIATTQYAKITVSRQPTTLQSCKI